MRNLKLQMNIALNNKWDDEMTAFSINNLKNVDNILHGRNTAEGFIPYWEEVANNPEDDTYELGKLLHNIPNIVFSNKLEASKWNNVTVVKGDITEEINALKKKEGKDMMVYGGDSFAASLIQHQLVDELYLLVDPASLGNGQATFNPLKDNSQLTLKTSRPFPSGTVLLHYKR